MKTLGQARTSSDTPLWHLLKQAVRWEEVRIAWGLRYGLNDLVEKATAKAAQYETHYYSLPETAHLSKPPRYWR